MGGNKTNREEINQRRFQFNNSKLPNKSNATIDNFTIYRKEFVLLSSLSEYGKYARKSLGENEVCDSREFILFT